MPEVTVLMAVYNGMPYLPEAVDSILQQTLENWEFVIVDDGSTDATPRLLDQLNDPRIRVVRLHNSGLGAALNRGLAECHTEFLARMDSDDVAHPERLEVQLDFLRQRADVGLVGSQVQRLGALRGASRSLVPCDHQGLIEHLMKGLPAIAHPTIMCRTNLLKQIGGYWEHRFGEEWDMFLRMGEVSQLANVDQVLLSYRLDQGSMTGANMKVMRLHIDFSIESARRRHAKSGPITLSEFEASRRAQPWWTRTGRYLDIYARLQYRQAMVDLLGSRQIRGFTRLGWSAMCSPKLTAQRIGREIGYRWRSRSQTAGREDRSQADGRHLP